MPATQTLQQYQGELVLRFCVTLLSTLGDKRDVSTRAKLCGGFFVCFAR
jgi:hypothetical protein